MIPFMISVSANLILIFSLGFASNAKTESDKNLKIPSECIKWFIKGKVAKGKSCEVSCAVLESDMSSFDCSRFCDALCNDEKP